MTHPKLRMRLTVGRTMKGINAERCAVTLENDPDGVWWARIGILTEFSGPSPRLALRAAIKAWNEENTHA